MKLTIYMQYMIIQIIFYLLEEVMIFIFVMVAMKRIILIPIDQKSFSQESSDKTLCPRL